MAAEMKRLDTELLSARKAAADLVIELKAVRSQLAMQVSVNKDLMHRKEAVEWELMGLRAQVSSHRQQERPLVPFMPTSTGPLDNELLGSRNQM